MKLSSGIVVLSLLAALGTGCSKGDSTSDSSPSPSRTPKSGLKDKDPKPAPSPSVIPNPEPSAVPSTLPSAVPSATPSGMPSPEPSAVPSAVPTSVPSATPSTTPSSSPSTPRATAPAFTRLSFVVEISRENSTPDFQGYVVDLGTREVYGPFHASPGIGWFSSAGNVVASIVNGHLGLFDLQGQPLPGFTSAGRSTIQSVQVSQTVIAYVKRTGRNRGTRQINLFNNQGQPLAGFTPARISHNDHGNVSGMYSISDRYVAYIDTDRNLVVLDSSGTRIDVGTISNVNEVQVSNEAVAYLAQIEGQNSDSLHVLNPENQTTRRIGDNFQRTSWTLSGDQISYRRQTVEEGITWLEKVDAENGRVLHRLNQSIVESASNLSIEPFVLADLQEGNLRIVGTDGQPIWLRSVNASRVHEILFR